MTPGERDRFDLLSHEHYELGYAIQLVANRGYEAKIGRRTAREFLMQKLAHLGVAVNFMLDSRGGKGKADLDANYMNNCAVKRMADLAEH